MKPLLVNIRSTYGPQRFNPVVRVKAITMRKDVIYQSCFVGHPDNLLLSGVTRCSQILNREKYMPDCYGGQHALVRQMSIYMLRCHGEIN